jgi:hypothetical protein
MAPHQRHYRAKMKERGWLDESGEVVWPKDATTRAKMARGFWGIELVSGVDYWLLLAEDELDDTHSAPWASPEDKLPPEKAQQRTVLKTLTAEQRQAVRDLLRYAVKGEFYSFCIALDQTLGGATVTVEDPGKPSESVELHSPRQEELHREQYQWLEDFSILFGKDER